MSSAPVELGPHFVGTQIRDDGQGPLLVSHRLQLTVVAGPDAGSQSALQGTHFRIGTATDNDLVLSDATVSRQHCEIIVRDDRYLVRDLNATNGTSLNGTPVIEAYLAPGARLSLGDTQLLFEPKKKWERIVASEDDHFGDLYGVSNRMRQVFAVLRKVAETDLTCLLNGETGTGKELAARAVHAHSRRSSHPLVVVDCGAISANLMESELFGHERGAFTSAERQRIGAFEAADGGTVFLDELGELPLPLQPKLLRVLEHQELKRVGATKSFQVNVRVIAATHRDLPAMVAEGTFREDLYYRLAEAAVTLPPLRERREDLPIIAARILSQMAAQAQGGSPKAPMALSSEAVQELQQRQWPGNIRQMRNLLRRAASMCSGHVLQLDDLQRLVEPNEAATAATPSQFDIPTQRIAASLPIREARERWIEPFEREYLLSLVKNCDGDLDQAAQRAGIHRKSFERLLRQHQIKPSELRK